jgi:3-deoxy-D-manno-octulosonate 8-phosphate phosphatase (KDO 8-P phosphatase)
VSVRTTKGALGALIKDVRLVVFDFDGVFTDNTVVAFDDSTEAVSCWRGDGLGLRELRRLGIDAFVLSTETNQVVGVRCRKLAIPFIQGCADKRNSLLELVRERKLKLGQVAYVGNDVNDLECLRIVGLPIVVGDAHKSVLSAARWRTKLPGGRGAVREICDTFSERLSRGSPSPKRRHAS